MGKGRERPVWKTGGGVVQSLVKTESGRIEIASLFQCITRKTGKGGGDPGGQRLGTETKNEDKDQGREQRMEEGAPDGALPK